jgi:hypothetical protein
MYIGDKVKFNNELGEMMKGEVTEVLSDSYDDVIVNTSGGVEYYSKKTGKYVPVRAKHEASIFWEVKTDTGLEYVLENELVEGLSGNL